MKSVSHSAVAAAGLTIVCCLGWISPLINPRHPFIYHSGGRAQSIFIPILLDMLLLWLGLTVVLWLATRSSRARVLVWLGVILFIPWLLLRDLSQLLFFKLPHPISVALFFGLGLGWVALVVLWRPAFVPAFDYVQHFSNSMLRVAAVFGVLVVGQMFWSFWGARGLRTTEALQAPEIRTTNGAKARKLRVIWIILDELSYRQVYEHRFPSLELPAFDRLAQQATVFTDVAPAALYTEAAVPSLMSGLRVDGISASADGELHLLHDPVTGRWQPFAARDTVFQDALEHGFRTGVVGWYNPYCRILEGALDRCRWIYRQEYDGGLFTDSSTPANLFASWADLFQKAEMRGMEDSKKRNERARRTLPIMSIWFRRATGCCRILMLISCCCTCRFRIRAGSTIGARSRSPYIMLLTSTTWRWQMCTLRMCGKFWSSGASGIRPRW